MNTGSKVEARKEDKWLAEERGDFHESVPAITVIVDGGWSKRSHKHSYNAKSGEGVIIGKASSYMCDLIRNNVYKGLYIAQYAFKQLQSH